VVFLIERNNVNKIGVKSRRLIYFSVIFKIFCPVSFWYFRTCSIIPCQPLFIKSVQQCTCMFFFLKISQYSLFNCAYSRKFFTSFPVNQAGVSSFRISSFRQLSQISFLQYGHRLTFSLDPHSAHFFEKKANKYHQFKGIITNFRARYLLWDN